MKKLEQKITYSYYRYASESFKLFVAGKQLKLDNPSEFGYLAIKGDKKALMDMIKQFIRTKTNITQKEKSLLMVWPISASNSFIHISERVKQYDIESKLETFKNIKRALEATNYQNPITTNKAELDGHYNIIKVTDETQKLNLARRIRLIA